MRITRSATHAGLRGLQIADPPPHLAKPLIGVQLQQHPATSLVFRSFQRGRIRFSLLDSKHLEKQVWRIASMPYLVPTSGTVQP